METSGAVISPVKQILRVEQALFLVALVIAYWHVHASWWVFAIFLLAPDLFMVGYLKNTRIGALCYNSSHSFIGPLICAGIAILYPIVLPAAIIWASHIAFDRALGYGLKYADSFGHTHLGEIGKNVPDTSV